MVYQCPAPGLELSRPSIWDSISTVHQLSDFALTSDLCLSYLTHSLSHSLGLPSSNGIASHLATFAV